MKHSIKTLFILLLLNQTISFAHENLAGKVGTTFKAGNTTELVKLFDENLELVIDSEQVSYFKIANSHAELILKNFFKKHPPQDFRIVFQNENNCLGNYKSSGENYLVYIQIKTDVAGKSTIQKLHLRKDYQKY